MFCKQQKQWAPRLIFTVNIYIGSMSLNTSRDMQMANVFSLPSTLQLVRSVCTCSIVTGQSISNLTPTQYSQIHRAEKHCLSVLRKTKAYVTQAHFNHAFTMEQNSLQLGLSPAYKRHCAALCLGSSLLCFTE